MKPLIPLVCIALLSSTALAEIFSLQDTATDKTHGPYSFQHGTAIEIEGTQWKLIHIDPRHNEILATAKKINIPNLDFRDADIKDVSLFISETCRRVSVGTPAILLDHSVEPTQTVTMSIRDMSLFDTLQVICDMTGTRWTVRHGVIFLDASEKFSPPANIPSVPVTPHELFSLQSPETGKTFGPFKLLNKNYIQLDTMILEIEQETVDAKTIAVLKSTTIPALDFRDANPADAALFLNATVQRLKDGRQPDVQIIVDKGMQNRTHRITCSIRHKSLYDVIGIISDVSGLAWEIDGSNVVLKKAVP